VNAFVVSCKAWLCLCSLPCLSVLDAFYDGRLYRCGIKFSGEDLNETSDGEANIASVSLPDCQQESDDDWEEKEASRTHSVKFTDDLDQDQNKEVSRSKLVWED